MGLGFVGAWRFAGVVGAMVGFWPGVEVRVLAVSGERMAGFHCGFMGSWVHGLMASRALYYPALLKGSIKQQLCSPVNSLSLSR